MNNAILSFFSHTLVNATVGSTQMLKDIAADLATATDLTQASVLTKRLATITTRMSVIESLANVFKLYTSEPYALCREWKADQGHNYTVTQTVVFALQMTLLRFCQMPEFQSARKKLLPNVSCKMLTAELISAIIPLDGSSTTQLKQVVNWIETRMPFIRLALNNIEYIHIRENGARHIVIFALISEFLTNALKYTALSSEPDSHILLQVSPAPLGLYIACSNTIDNEISTPFGDNMRLAFIKEVCNQVEADFPDPVNLDGEFWVETFTYTNTRTRKVLP